MLQECQNFISFSQAAVSGSLRVRPYWCMTIKLHVLSTSYLGLLALVRRKPEACPRYGARMRPSLEGYAASDALLTEMEVPYYENLATIRTNNLVAQKMTA